MSLARGLQVGTNAEFCRGGPARGLSDSTWLYRDRSADSFNTRATCVKCNSDGAADTVPADHPPDCSLKLTLPWLLPTLCNRSVFYFARESDADGSAFGGN
jgi:hypothetical protein